MFFFTRILLLYETLKIVMKNSKNSEYRMQVPYFKKVVKIYLKKERTINFDILPIHIKS